MKLIIEMIGRQDLEFGSGCDDHRGSSSSHEVELIVGCDRRRVDVSELWNASPRNEFFSVTRLQASQDTLVGLREVKLALVEHGDPALLVLGKRRIVDMRVTDKDVVIVLRHALKSLFFTKGFYHARNELKPSKEQNSASPCNVKAELLISWKLGDTKYELQAFT